MLKINNLTYRIQGRPLFEDASLVLPDGAKAGFVGKNGTGKTTLFHLIQGHIGADSGSTEVNKKARIGAVAQEAPAGDETVLEVVLAADKERAALLKAVRDGGTSTQLLSGYESWAAAMLLSAASQQALHVSQDDGVEPALIAAFKKAGKPIGGLETVERQFRAFDTLPEAAQARLLVQTVHEADGMKALYDRILTAWLKGDMAAIAKEDERGEQPDLVVEDAVLVARNRDWARAIEPMRGQPFIAVGAGHLTGRDNLIDLLKDRGFTITRVQ